MKSYSSPNRTWNAFWMNRPFTQRSRTASLGPGTSTPIQDSSGSVNMRGHEFITRNLPVTVIVSFTARASCEKRTSKNATLRMRTNGSRLCSPCAAAGRTSSRQAAITRHAASAARLPVVLNVRMARSVAPVMHVVLGDAESRDPVQVWRSTLRSGTTPSSLPTPRPSQYTSVHAMPAIRTLIQIRWPRKDWSVPSSMRRRYSGVCGRMK